MSFHSTLYVGNVAYSSDEADLTDLFSQYGNVLSTEIKRGFAFVKFETVPSAQAAAQALDNHLFNGRNLKVNFSKSEPHPSNRQTPFQPNNNNNNNINSNQNANINSARPQQQRVSYKENSIHVANLPHTISEENLREVFEPYGILTIHIIRTRKICFAIIELSSEENMTNAIDEKKELVVDGREIAVTKQIIVPERHNNNFARGGRGRGFRGNYRRGFGRGGNFQRNDQTFRIDNNLHNNVNNQNNNSPIDEQQKPRGDFYDNNKYQGSYRYRGDMFGGRGQYSGGRGQYRPRGRGGYRGGRGRNNNLFSENSGPSE